MNFQTPEQIERDAASEVAAQYHRAPASTGRERTELARLARQYFGVSAEPSEIDAIVSSASQRLRAMGYTIPPMYSQYDFS
jgi:hypothetical protein